MHQVQRVGVVNVAGRPHELVALLSRAGAGGPGGGGGQGGAGSGEVVTTL